MGRRAVTTSGAFCVQVLTPKDGVVVLAPCGELDLYTSPELRARLLAALDDGFARVVVDLTQVTFFDFSRPGSAGGRGPPVGCRSDRS